MPGTAANALWIGRRSPPVRTVTSALASKRVSFTSSWSPRLTRLKAFASLTIDCHAAPEVGSDMSRLRLIRISPIAADPAGIAGPAAGAGVAAGRGVGVACWGAGVGAGAVTAVGTAVGATVAVGAVVGAEVGRAVAVAVAARSDRSSTTSRRVEASTLLADRPRARLSHRAE